jgi:hypothetical protein
MPPTDLVHLDQETAGKDRELGPARGREAHELEKL